MTSSFRDSFPRLMVRAGSMLLPAPLRHWGEAAEEEVESIERWGEAMLFALGCLGWVTRETLRFHLARAWGSGGGHSDQEEMTAMPGFAALIRRPRTIALSCGIAATLLGLVYMAVAGAPARYLMINVGALAFGCVALMILIKAASRGHLKTGPIVLALGVGLLAMSIWGVTANGVTRWIALGGLSIQPSLMVVPLMGVLFARSRDAVSLAGLSVAAIGLALQPDRGMAAALASGLMVLSFVRPNRSVRLATAVAVAAFSVTLARPDPSPAVPYVDRILYSAFEVHSLAGLAVLAGSVVLLAPAFMPLRGRDEDRAAYAVFGAAWSAILLAAALGNFPTPLVGYGGSAIIGYFVSLIAFPVSVPVVRQASPETTPGDEAEPPALLVSAA